MHVTSQGGFPKRGGPRQVPRSPPLNTPLCEMLLPVGRFWKSIVN